MVSLLITLLLFFKTITTFSSTLEYRFYKNFGQRFIDYSGNSFHGINGGLLCEDSLDSIQTDRGVMMTKNVHQVKIPVINPFKKLLFNSKEFSIAFWMKVTKKPSTTTNIFGRYLGTNKYLRVVNDDYMFKVEYYNKVLLNIAHTTSYKEGKNHLDEWTFIGLSIKSTELKFYINSLVQTSSITQIWNENSKGTCLLGSHTYNYKSFEGFIFYFSVKSEPLTLSDYIGEQTSDCYRGTCNSNTLTFSVMIEGKEYILSSINSEKQDSSSNNCPNSCTNSCIGNLCLDCSCQFLSCEIKTTFTDSTSTNLLKDFISEIYCYCEQGSNISKDICYCDQGYFNGFECQDYQQATGLCSFSYSNGECHLCNNLYYVPYGNTCICSSKCLKTSSICQQCGPTCKDCKNSKCLSCNDPNSSIDPFDYSTCICNDGYYMEENACLPCDQSCNFCENATICTECKEPSPDITTGVCICDKGFYFDVSELTCNQCDENCLTCLNNSQCFECKTKYAVASTDNNCECENDSILISNECKCLPGTYRDENSKCVKCQDFCEECSLDSEVVCSSCSNNLMLVNKTCICEAGYFVNQSNFCVETCENGYEVLNNTCVEICGDKCEICPGFICELCINNSQSLDGVNCECKKGFGGDLCEMLFFSAEVFGFDNKSVLVEFSESVVVSLEGSDFEIRYQNRNVNFNISFASKRVYVLDLDIDSNYTLEFFIRISEVEGENGAMLYPKEYGFIITFNEAENRSDESSSQTTQTQIQISATTSKVANVTTTITKAVISTSITAAIVSNPSSFWTLFNTIEFISFLPLNSVKYPQKLKTFIQSFGSYSMIPIPIKSKNLIDKGPNPYKEADDYGLETSLIIVNTFIYFATFVGFIVILLILLLLRAIGGCGYIEFINRKIEDYKFGFFIRFWIQGYLGLGIMAGVELKSWIENKRSEISSISVFSFCISIIIFALSSLTPTFVLIFVIRNKRSIRLEGSEFLKKYGSLFSELKNNKGLKVSLYYFVFFLRRLLYIYAQIFLNDYSYLQISLNVAGGCFIVVYILSIFPFIEKINFLTTLIGEVITLEVSILTLFFIGSDDEKKLVLVSDVITFSILAMISINFLISIYQLFHLIKTAIQRITKANNTLEPQNTSSIYPNTLCITSQENRLNDKDFSVSEMN